MNFDNGIPVTCMHVIRRVGLATLQCKIGVAAAMLKKIQLSNTNEKLQPTKAIGGGLTLAYNSLTKIPSKAGA